MVKGDYPWYQLHLFKYNEALSNRKKSITRKPSLRSSSMQKELGRTGSSELYVEYFRTGKQGKEREWKTTPVINYDKLYVKKVGYCSGFIFAVHYLSIAGVVCHNTSHARVADLIEPCLAFML